MSDCFGLLFPGQGSQYVGMGADLCEIFPAARETYERAEQMLGLPIRRLSFEGPADELRQTRFTQPAILTHSLAVLSAVPGLMPRVVAGHSLGEYSALFAAGVLDFKSVLILVKRRAELMYSEGEKNPGTMAAVMGLDSDVVDAVCRDAGGVVVAANYNEPKQTVISGEVEAVKRAIELARERGALKTLLLPVSGAFHSPLLRDSAASFAEFLAGFELHPPRCAVVMNVTGETASSVEEIRANLARQLISPVQWFRTITTARESGCRRFYEVGPRQVLSGLVRRIDRELSVSPLGRASEANAVVESEAGGR